MNLLQSKGKGRGFCNEATVKVLVAYQDVDCALRARRALDGVVENLEPGFRALTWFWSFTILEAQPLREEAARNGAEADIIWISTPDDAELPPPVRAWLECSISQRERRPGALVLHCATRGAGCLGADLRRVASLGALDFFAPKETLPAEGGDISPSDAFLSPVLVAEDFDPPRGIPRWGINE